MTTQERLATLLVRVFLPWGPRFSLTRDHKILDRNMPRDGAAPRLHALGEIWRCIALDTTWKTLDLLRLVKRE
jgi:hypothetical protein